MSALGQKQTFCDAGTMSALPPKADIPCGDEHVCFVPIADIHSRSVAPTLPIGLQSFWQD